MTKKIISIILVISLLGSLTGCDTLRRKFVRKKKAKPVRPMFYIEEDGEYIKPPIEAYTTHYVFWNTWMVDLIQNAGTNEKRDKMAASEAMANLKDMHKYLTGEKKEELANYIKDVEGVLAKIETGSLNTANVGNLKHELDKLRARIARKFYYKKVREYIRTE